MTSIAALQDALNTIAVLHSENPALDSTTAVLRLRKTHPTLDRETLSLAVETYFSRRVAAEKLGSWAEIGFFTTDLLEQATRSAIAAHRASFFTGLSHVLEIGTGTGSDTAALARVVGHVTSIEADPMRADLARENLRVQGVENVTVVVGDSIELIPSLNSTTYDGLYADPARRTRNGSRVREGSDYSPPLDFLLNVSIGKVSALKVSPGLFFNPDGSEWRRHFVGVGDECLEQTLVRGVPIADSSVHLADRDVSWAPPKDPIPFPTEPSALLGYITEAHAVVNRSQHLRSFFAERGISQLAPDVAYGVSSSAPIRSPLLQSFRITDSFPYSTSTLRGALHSLGWSSRTEIKKRTCTLDIDAIRTSLRLPAHCHGAPYGTIFIFKWHGKHQVILAERIGD